MEITKPGHSRDRPPDPEHRGRWNCDHEQSATDSYVHAHSHPAPYSYIHVYAIGHSHLYSDIHPYEHTLLNTDGHAITDSDSTHAYKEPTRSTARSASGKHRAGTD